METESAGLQDYIALFRRRRCVMFVAFSAISVAVVFGTLLLEDQYRSTARIAIVRTIFSGISARTIAILAVERY